MDDIPCKEVWNWQEGALTTCELEYLSKSAKKGDAAEHKADQFMVDLEMCVKKAEEIQDSGWLLLACDSDNFIWKRDTYFYGHKPNRINGDLYWENLIRDFHFHHRSFNTGRMLDKTYQLNSVRRVKRQEGVKFPRLEKVNTMRLIMTNLGPGEIEKIELSTDTDFYTATLRFSFDYSGEYNKLLTVDNTSIRVSGTSIKVSQTHEIMSIN